MGEGAPQSECRGTLRRIDAMKPQTADASERAVDDRAIGSHDIESSQGIPETCAVAGTGRQATTSVRPIDTRPPRADTPAPIKRRPVPKRALQILPNPEPGDLRPYALWEYQDPPAPTQEGAAIASRSVSEWTKRSDSLTRIMKKLVRSSRGSKRSKANTRVDKHMSEVELPRTEPSKSRGEQRSNDSPDNATSCRRTERGEPTTARGSSENLKPTGINPATSVSGPRVRSMTDQYLVPSLGPDRYGKTALDHAHELPLASQRYLNATSSFGKGDILSVPFHRSDLHRTTQHRYYSKPLYTPHGPVHSLRRLVVVLWLFGETMLSLPLYSFALEGVMAVPQRLQKEYVALMDERDQIEHSIGEQGIPRIQGGCYGTKRMHLKALVYLSGAVEARYQDDIMCVGRLSEKSFEELSTAHAVAGEQTINCPWQRRMEAKCS